MKNILKNTLKITLIKSYKLLKLLDITSFFLHCMIDFVFKKETMANKRGMSLTETLVALSIMGMLMGVATVFYRGYTVDTAKKDLKQSGLLFASSVSSCIQASGGWIVTRPDGTKIKPCKVLKGANTLKKFKADLKNTLNYTCPRDTNCVTVVHGNPRHPKWQYYCLGIRKKISGKHLQVITRVAWHNPSSYQLWCGQAPSASDYVTLNDTTCKKSKTQILREAGKTDGKSAWLQTPCPWK